MVDVFVPHGYASKSFWPRSEESEILLENESCDQVEIQPFSIYQIAQPHVIRKRHGHLGVSPRCRASILESMDLVRKVLQPAINQDIFDVLKKYLMVFRNAAENAVANMKVEPFTNFLTQSENDIDDLVYKICCDALEHSKSLFDGRKPVKDLKMEKSPQQNTTKQNARQIASSLPGHLISMKRVPSPEFPWTKRLSKPSPRRSLSPTPRKRGRPTPTKRYGSPQRNSKEPLRRDHWDPDKLTTDTKFVMGTKANKALGLGATRGRIYMKHPDLFKYSSDPDDKKWMVKNNCMVATGGKNTFIMIADNIFDLLENEYKESAGLMPEEMQVFNLPEFILQKMRSLMIKEKKLSEKLMGKTASLPPTPVSKPDIRIKTEWIPSKPVSPKPEAKTGKPTIVSLTSSPHSKRPAAERAAAAITASSTSGEDERNMEQQQSLDSRGPVGQSSSSEGSSEPGSSAEDSPGQLSMDT